MPGCVRSLSDMKQTPSDIETPLERHPWQPFVPSGAKLLIMGTFPPAPSRWSMDFYYPNRINDFWRVMGIIFYGNKDALLLPDGKNFNLDEIKRMLTLHGIALSDTGVEVRRLRGNASDKFLEIVTPRDLGALLEKMPDCHTVATTGEKAADVVAALTNTPLPRMGEMIPTRFPAGRELTISRMPSTSRAYPMNVETKAGFYRRLMEHAGIIKKND